MTTNWLPGPMWHGKTVAVLASGPSMSESVASSLRRHKTIAVNYTHLLAPWADMLLVLDLNRKLWASAEGFKGLRISGVQADDLDAYHAGSMFEHVRLGPCHTVEVRNSGLAAIRMAAQLGAAKIILAGFDPDAPGYFAGHPAPGKPLNEAVFVGLRAMVAELRGQGIVIEYHSDQAQEKPQQRARRRRKV